MLRISFVVVLLALFFSVAAECRAEFIGDQTLAGVSVHTTGITGVVFSLDDAGSGLHNAVVYADVATGNRTVISQPGVVGSGPDFGSLVQGLAVEKSGSILLAGFDADAVFRIDPLTGNRSIVSGPTVGTGPAIDGATDVVVGPNGDIYVGTGSSDSIIRIDPLTGNRTVVTGPSVGTGPTLDYAASLTLTPNGDFYSVSANTDLLFFIEAATGNRTIVSGGGVGSGPAFGVIINDVQLLSDGSLAVTDGQRIFHVDPLTGNRSILSDATTGAGTILGSMEWLTLTPGGLLLASGDSSVSSRNYGVFLIDPATGDRLMITGKNVGSGISNSGVFREAAVYNNFVVPESSSLALALASTVGLIVLQRRRRQKCRVA